MDQQKSTVIFGAMVASEAILKAQNPTAALKRENSYDIESLIVWAGLQSLQILALPTCWHFGLKIKIRYPLT